MFGGITSTIKKFGSYWNEVLQDIDGFHSSKRLGFIIGCFVVLGSWIANVFWQIVVDAHILQAALGLGGVAGAGIAGERFGKVTAPDSAPPATKDAPSGLKND